MKTFALLSAVLALSLTLTTGDAEAARRMGGGKSFGMQREAVSPQKAPGATPGAPAPSQATAPSSANAQGAGAAQAQPKRSWMGPLAGLAAGLGLAALASHFGFGEGLANLLLIGLVIMVVMAVIGMVMRRRAAAQTGSSGLGAMSYAGAGADFRNERSAAPEFSPVSAGGSAAPSPAASAGHIPADFDAEGFVRTAKVNFLRLQAANDAGNLDDIREFTTPEMFAEIKMGMTERGSATQETDVIQLDAQVLDVAEETSRYVVSVRFQGVEREGKAGPTESFDEVWHMVKPRDGSRGWTLAGIQQVS